MRVIQFCLFFLGSFIVANSQEQAVFSPGKQPYIVVDTLATGLRYMVLSPKKIESVNVLKNGSAVEVYGDKAKYGAVVIKTKPGTRLLRVGDILDRYKVPETDQQLRVCINKTLISQPELIVIDESELLGVEITTDRHWIHPEDANSNERLINIRTAAPE